MEALLYLDDTMAALQMSKSILLKGYWLARTMQKRQGIKFCFISHKYMTRV